MNDILDDLFGIAEIPNPLASVAIIILACGLVYMFFSWMRWLTALARDQARLEGVYKRESSDDVEFGQRQYAVMKKHAESEGLTYCGLYRSEERVKYCWGYESFWLSADKDVIVVINIVLHRHRGAQPLGYFVLRTRFEDDTVIVTTTLAGYPHLTGDAYVPNPLPKCKSLAKLLAHHKSRVLEEIGKQPKRTSPPQVIECWLEMERIRVAALVERGYAKYVDDTCNIWQYNYRGAVAVQLGTEKARWRSRLGLTVEGS